MTKMRSRKRVRKRIKPRKKKAWLIDMTEEKKSVRDELEKRCLLRGIIDMEFGLMVWGVYEMQRFEWRIIQRRRRRIYCFKSMVVKRTGFTRSNAYFPLVLGQFIGSNGKLTLAFVKCKLPEL